MRNALRLLVLLTMSLALSGQVAAWAQPAALRAGMPRDVCIFEAARLWPSEIAASEAQVVDDPEATSGGRALQLVPKKRVNWEPREGRYFFFDPDQGPVGEVTLTVRMKIASVDEETPNFYLAAKSGDWLLVRRFLTPRDFGAANTYRDFSVRFMRRPGEATGAGLVWLDWGPQTALTIDTLTLSATGRPCGVGRVQADRLWYRCGQTARVSATAANHTDAVQQVTLQGLLVGDLDQVRPVYSGPLTLAPREVKEISCTFDVGRREWGHDLQVALVQEGRTIASASDTVTVADNAYKTCATYDNVHGSRNWSGPEGQARAWLVPRFRHGYVSVVEVYSWSPGQVADMTPQHDTWLSGQGNYREGRAGLTDFIKYCHEAGLAVVSYYQTSIHGIAGMDWAREHPDWLSWDAVTGRPQLWYDVAQTERQRDPQPRDDNWYGTFALGCVNLMDPGLVDHMTGELIGAARMFGFDGVRWDGEPRIATLAAIPDTGIPEGMVASYEGKPLNGFPNSDHLSATIMERMNSRLRRELPGFIFGYNNCPTHGGVVWPQTIPEHWKTIVPDAYSLDENLTDRGWTSDPNNLWSRYARRIVESVDYVRPYGGYHYSGPFAAGGAVWASHHLATLYAAGSRPWRDGYAIRNDYARFALRYAELLLGNASRRVAQPTKLLRVESPAPVWWEDYVYSWAVDRRTTRTLVHLLNPPVKAWIDKSETRAPRLQQDLTVTGQPPTAGAKLRRAWVLSPDAEACCVLARTQPLGAAARVTVPELRYWSIVVFEWSNP